MCDPIGVHVIEHYLHHLGQAIKLGMAKGYLTYNPVSSLRPLRRDHTEMQVWTAGEVKQFLAVADLQSYHPLWELAAKTGMRKGELLGLKRIDVDLDHAVIHVRRSVSHAGGKFQIEDTKTHQSRTIDIDGDLVDVLRQHMEQQDEQRKQAGPNWQAGDWLCASAVGTPLNEYSVTRAFHGLVNTARVKRIRFHDMRHTCASLLLAAGVPVHVVSRQLGYA